jgi:hypothetical protein
MSPMTSHAEDLMHNLLPESRFCQGRCQFGGKPHRATHGLVDKRERVRPVCPCRAWFADAERQARLLRKRMRMCW